MRKFCEPLKLTDEQYRKLRDEIAKWPKMEYWFNCHGDTLIYENSVLVGKQKKDGTYIDYGKPSVSG